MIEDKKTHEIEFLALKLITDSSKNKKITLCGLSINEENITGFEEKKTEIVKSCEALVRDKITDKVTQITLLLRMDGSIEAYIDFIFRSRISNPKMQCIDIEAGNRSFHFKMIKNSHLVTANTSLDDLKRRS